MHTTQLKCLYVCIFTAITSYLFKPKTDLALLANPYLVIKLWPCCIFQTNQTFSEYLMLLVPHNHINASMFSLCFVFLTRLSTLVKRYWILRQLCISFWFPENVYIHLRKTNPSKLISITTSYTKSLSVSWCPLL